MSSIIFNLFLTFGLILSLFLNRIFHQLYFKQNLIDEINHRSSHTVIATRSGGIAIFSSLFIVLIVFHYIYDLNYNLNLISALFISLTTGFFDDIFKLSYRYKIIIQIFVGYLLTQSGYMINDFHGVFGLNTIPYYPSICISVFVYLVITNAFNLIDGIDGLLGLMSSYILIVFSILFWASSIELFTISIPLIGIIGGLLYHNFKPIKKVFLGDAGSLTIGTLFSFFAFWLLDSNNVLVTEPYINRSLFAVLIFIYPLSDTLRVFILRISKGKSPFHPDRLHLHHYLVDKGYTHIYASVQIVFFSAVLLFLNLLLYNILELNYAIMFNLTYLISIFYLRFR